MAGLTYEDERRVRLGIRLGISLGTKPIGSFSSVPRPDSLRAYFDTAGMGCPNHWPPRPRIDSFPNRCPDENCSRRDEGGLYQLPGHDLRVQPGTVEGVYALGTLSTLTSPQSYRESSPIRRPPRDGFI